MATQRAKVKRAEAELKRQLRNKRARERRAKLRVEAVQTGRPQAFTPELEEELCNALITATCGSSRLCDRSERFPSSTTLWRHLTKSKTFRAKLDAAREMQLENIQSNSYDDLCKHEIGESPVEPTKLAHKVAIVREGRQMSAQIAPARFGQKAEVKVSADEGLVAQLDAALRKRQSQREENDSE